MNLPSIFSERAGSLVLTALLIGCAHSGGAVDEDSSSFVRSDSAGVVIVETANQVASGDIGWAVADEPNFEFRLFAEGQSPPLPLPFMVRLTRSGDHTVVADRRAVEVRFFGPEGEPSHRFFRPRGDAPGEFRGMALVPAPAADSLLLWDSGNRRFTLLAPDGSGSRVIPRSEPEARDFDTVRILFQLGLVGDMLLMQAIGSSGSPPIDDRGVASTSVVFWLENLHDGARIELGEFEGVRFLYPTTPMELAHDMIERESFTPPANMPPPIAAPFRTPATAAPATGFFVFTKGEGPEILRFGDDGALLSIMRLREPKLVTRSDVEAFTEWQAEALGPDRGTPAEVRAMVELLPIPEVWPGFERLLVDTEGWTWAQLYHFDPSRSNTWVVFDPEGRAQGTVETPPRLDIHFIGEDFILGVARDGLDVQFVREYALDRSPRSTP
jgi:hypothetical protein